LPALIAFIPLKDDQVDNEQPGPITAADKLARGLEFLPNYPDSTLKIVEQLILQENIQADDSLYVMAKYAEGTAYYFKDYYNLALDSYRVALNSDYAQRDSSFRVRILNNMGVCYDNLKQHDEALRYYQQALEIEKESGNPVELSDMYINIGLVYYAIGEYEEALENFKTANSLIEDQPVGYRHGLVQQNLGIAYKELGRSEESITATRRAIEIFDEQNIYRSKLQSTHNLALYHIDNQYNLDEIVELLTDTIEESIEYGIPVQQAMLIIQRGRIEQIRENPESALIYFSRADSIFKSLDDFYSRYPLVLHEYLIQTYSLLGNTDKVMEIFRENETIKEERNLVSQTTAINELNLQLEVNENLAKLQEQALELQQQRNTLVISFLLLFIIGAALAGLIILYRKKNNAYALLAENKKELEQVSIEKDKLLSILAHDLRTPISNLQGVVFLIQEGIINGDDLDTILQNIDFQLMQGIATLSNYLQWAQNQKDGIKATLGPTSIEEIINQSIDETMPGANKKNLDLEVDVEKGLHAIADPDLMKVVLRNLISNAIKFIDVGGDIKVKASSKNGKVLLSVSDTGDGIPVKNQDSVFDAFGNSATGTMGEIGTGLGLSICKDFVEKQNGSISFESEQGKGTVFIIELNKAE
tara:strand:+ start:2107 stop:4044 length:1938 start_codon:yes stop_codon:yes gene_type:complete